MSYVIRSGSYVNSGELLKFGNQNFGMVKIFSFMKIDKKK